MCDKPVLYFGHTQALSHLFNLFQSWCLWKERSWVDDPACMHAYTTAAFQAGNGKCCHSFVHVNLIYDQYIKKVFPSSPLFPGLAQLTSSAKKWDYKLVPFFLTYWSLLEGRPWNNLTTSKQICDKGFDFFVFKRSASSYYQNLAGLQRWDAMSCGYCLWFQKKS